MPNGFGLEGNGSATHSGMIFPSPEGSDIFYIFTVDAVEGTLDGLHYSKVDMSLNSGLGDVVTTEKNIFLLDSASEKIAGAAKPGGYWAVTHRHGTDRFYSYEITRRQNSLVEWQTTTTEAALLLSLYLIQRLNYL